MIGRIFHVLFASPMRAAIVVGLAVAIGFGLFSLPQPEIVKSASDVSATGILSGEEGEQLSQAYQAAIDGNGELVEVSEDDFKAGDYAYTATFPAEQSGNRFFLRHVGQTALGDPTVYVWEEELFAAPWWSPHRFVYQAVKAETGAFGEVVQLTFERDIPGLIGLLLLDAVVGALYGAVVGPHRGGEEDRPDAAADAGAPLQHDHVVVAARPRQSLK